MIKEVIMVFKLKDTQTGLHELNPIKDNTLKIYTCGPTVYNYISIGNLRTYIASDVLKKCLLYVGYKIEDVMNITDVGHLVTDSDTGEDKLDKKARSEGKSAYEIADFYTKYFYSSIDKVNVRLPQVISKATDNIDKQIEIIQILDKKGLVYKTDTGVYFDVSKIKDYEKLLGQDIDKQKIASREDVKIDTTKKNQADFRLWQTEYPNHEMQWDSPWGRGFPGWHIECAAIVNKFLGNHIDIHTGGYDLIFPHHFNEKLISESAFDSKFVNFWVHSGLLLVEGEKMSKSLENIYTIEDIESKGFDPLSLRYLFLTSHYSTKLNFTFSSLQSAQNALFRIYNFIKLNKSLFDKDKKVSLEYKNKFEEKIKNNVDSPGMIDVLWQVIKDKNLDTSSKITTILDFDRVLSLDLHKYLLTEEVPEDISNMLLERKEYRDNKEWNEADNLRIKIEDRGYIVIDLKDNTFVIKK